jgi:hypothetical protein
MAFSSDAQLPDSTPHEVSHDHAMARASGGGSASDDEDEDRNPYPNPKWYDSEYYRENGGDDIWGLADSPDEDMYGADWTCGTDYFGEEGANQQGAACDSHA